MKLFIRAGLQRNNQTQDLKMRKESATYEHRTRM